MEGGVKVDKIVGVACVGKYRMGGYWGWLGGRRCGCRDAVIVVC